MSALGTELSKSLNDAIAIHVADRFGLEAKMRIRFDKAYRRFMIPRLRLDTGDGKTKGRAKGYAALVYEADGNTKVEIKGMEAARSDYTPLARRFQTELLDLIFRDADPVVVGNYVQDLCIAMRKESSTTNSSTARFSAVRLPPTTVWNRPRYAPRDCWAGRTTAKP